MSENQGELRTHVGFRALQGSGWVRGRRERRVEAVDPTPHQRGSTT
ncbi:hypothetical protein SSCG_04537 [Streptomyces clavuligerus]|nr:hypothetical protein SSCG_04537 [Streptomyces clavuligerus]